MSKPALSSSWSKHYVLPLTLPRSIFRLVRALVEGGVRSMRHEAFFFSCCCPPLTNTCASVAGLG